MAATTRQCFWIFTQGFGSKVIRAYSNPHLSTSPFGKLNRPTSNSVTSDVKGASLLVRYMDEEPHIRSALL